MVNLIVKLNIFENTFNYNKIGGVFNGWGRSNIHDYYNYHCNCSCYSYFSFLLNKIPFKKKIMNIV